MVYHYAPLTFSLSLSLSHAQSICPTFGGALAYPKESTFTQSGGPYLFLIVIY